MEHDVPGCLRIAFTLTTRAETSPEQWQGWKDALGMRFVRRGAAGIWRMEMQNRVNGIQVPHMHVAAFLDAIEIEVEVAYVMEAWLEITGQTGDLAARRHAVKWKAITSGGWAVYQALHDGKHKADQLGWKGKQWGIWNRKMFNPIVPDVEEFTDDQDKLFRRWMTRLVRATGGRTKCPRSGTFQRMCNQDTVRRLIAWVLQERPKIQKPIL
jgi:hypothetical protein